MLFDWLGINPSLPLDIFVHLCLEGIGGLILVLAYRFCDHFWHRALVWMILAPPMSFATVQLVG